ncbi:MAG TPA: hypothetical protein VJU80_06115 [Solirubrobacteraceae bacterium]|nr:hypothetical protein [Solirubrobacteraceae bacterium]
MTKPDRRHTHMHFRYMKGLAALAAAGAIGVPAVAQASGGSDDPVNHEQREHQVENHRRDLRFDNDRRDRRGDRIDNDRRDGRGSDDGPNHR